MARITKSFIDNLIARADIVAYVSQFVELKKTGKNHSACCPFHTEKSPSFTVSDQKQFYHCFGCGEHGNVITFAMEFSRLEFIEAVEDVASFVGIAVEYESNSAPRVKHDVDFYKINKGAAKAFYVNLRDADPQSDVVKYVESRGLSSEVIQRFGLGFAENSWGALGNSEFLKGVNKEHLVKLSLLTSKDGREYDFFRNRLMFPIRDRRGKFLAFGGRVLDGSKPKYINSSETPIFTKGAELYGVYEMTQQLKKIPFVMVVEGYMDVVSLSQNNFHNAVAPLGTALTPEQVATLFRMTDQIVLCFDGDKAGRSAAQRAMENGLSLLDDQKAMSVVFMPEGEDPDTLVRSLGVAGFEQYISQNSTPFSKYVMGVCRAQHDMGTTEGASSFGSAMIAYLRQMKDSLFKQQLIEETAQIVKVSVANVQRSVSGNKQFSVSKPEKKKDEFKITPVRTAIYSMLSYPEQVKSLEGVNEFLKSIDFDGKDALSEVYFAIKGGPSGINTGNLIYSLSESPFYKGYMKILMSPILVSGESAQEIVYDCLEKIADQSIEKRLSQLIALNKEQELTMDEKREMQMIISRNR